MIARGSAGNAAAQKLATCGLCPCASDNATQSVLLFFAFCFSCPFWRASFIDCLLRVPPCPQFSRRCCAAVHSHSSLSLSVDLARQWTDWQRQEWASINFLLMGSRVVQLAIPTSAACQGRAAARPYLIRSAIREDRTATRLGKEGPSHPERK